MKKSGWIALDIDGTVTFLKRSIPEKVKLYLKTLARDNWQIVFLTGRTFHFAFPALSDLNFFYYLAVQNGAELIELPEKKLIYQNFLDFSILKQVGEVYQNIKSDFLIYSGMEKGDFCYYRPHNFSDEHLAYLESLKARQEENWHALKDFDVEMVQKFPFIKCMGNEKLMRDVYSKLEKKEGMEISCIRDYHNPDFYLLLITNKMVSKGTTLKWLYEKKGDGPIICAGDDMNDLSMFKVADVKIAMSNAPQELKKMADFVAPLAQELGIIDGLDYAINRLG